MKHIYLILLGLLLPLTAMNAQSNGVGYLNTQTILSQIPDYVSAQQSLEKLNAQYKTAIEAESAKVDQAYKSYQSDRAGLSEAQKKARENEIITMERAVKELQKTYFGEDGVMAKQTAQLMNPIKERVDKAIERVAAEKKLILIIDVSSLQGVVYRNAEYDLSDEVVKYL